MGELFFRTVEELQGGQQTLETLEDPEKPWNLFPPGKVPWKTLKIQPTPEKLCSEVDFPRINFWPLFVW